MQTHAKPRPTVIRPPEYLPRLSTLALVDRAELCVLGDTLQYSRQSFHNRAKLRSVPGWQWASIPLQSRQHGQPICAAKIDHHARWQAQHERAFTYNYRSAPYFEFYEHDFEPLFATDWPSLGVVSVWTTKLLARLLGITTPLDVASESAGVLEKPETLAGLAERYDVRTLLTTETAAPHDAARVPSAEILAQRYRENERAQNFEGFVPGLSAVDALFNHGPSALQIMRDGVVATSEVDG
jgi:hypothetical protein